MTECGDADKNFRGAFDQRADVVLAGPAPAALAMTAKTYGLKIAAPVVALLSSSICAFAASFSA